MPVGNHHENPALKPLSLRRKVSLYQRLLLLSQDSGQTAFVDQFVLHISEKLSERFLLCKKKKKREQMKRPMVNICHNLHMLASGANHIK